MTQKTWVALKMKLRVCKHQTHTTIRTATSFENETDEEIDTTAMEEEEWIDYMKRNCKDEECKYPILDQKSQKNEMEAGAENRISTG